METEVEMHLTKTLNDACKSVIKKIERSVPVLSRELYDALSGRWGAVEEIRLRAISPSSYRVCGRDYLLRTRCDAKALSDILDTLTEGASYAYADSLKDGYVTIPGGVRIGIVGNALRGEVFGLVFRIPVSVRGKGEEIYRQWGKLGKCGLLIISAPGGGKTTALRSLAMHIGCGKDMRRVAVVDTRSEFLPEDYTSCSVDIITGRDRAEGIEMAVRTATPEVIMCDEIFSERDADALTGAVGAGITVIATAHGTSADSVRKRPFIDRLFTLGVFSGVISIEHKGSEFLYTAEGVSDAHGGRYTDTFRLSFNRQGI